MNRKDMIEKMVARYEVVKQDLLEDGSSFHPEVVTFFIMARILDMQEELGMAAPERKVVCTGPDGEYVNYVRRWGEENE